ncbi:hypothetical protein ASF62_02080 [Leifsonia sp. Leaf325]|nr:hypothetical protein [Leifsonia sp. Leaf325]KQQ95349.1 hypothetical protein ASF62_02080 [Leifsonia sp. Leaf325]
MPTHAPTIRPAAKRHSFWNSTAVFTIAQAAPIAIIAFAFISSSAELAGLELGGMPLTSLMLITSALVPIASQAIAGPVYAALGATDRSRFSDVSGVVLRSLPRSLVFGLPLVLAFTVLLGISIGLPADGVFALLGLVAVNMLFAASIVVAYVIRSGPMLFLAWIAYAAGIVIAPELWWLPSVAGAASQLAIILAPALRSAARPAARTPRETVLDIVRGICAALPFWAIPLAVLMSDPSGVEIGIVFLAVFPATILYQLFFILTAGPLWTAIDSTRASLSETASGEIAAVTSALRGTARRGEARLVLLVGITAVLALGGIAVAHMPSADLIATLLVTSCAAVLLIAQVVRFTMLHGNAVTYIVGIATIAELAIGSLLDDTQAMLSVHALFCLVVAGVLAVANAFAWRRAEYYLFWRRAMSA